MVAVGDGRSRCQDKEQRRVGGAAGSAHVGRGHYSGQCAFGGEARVCVGGLHVLPLWDHDSCVFYFNAVVATIELLLTQ